VRIEIISLFGLPFPVAPTRLKSGKVYSGFALGMRADDAFDFDQGAD